MEGVSGEYTRRVVECGIVWTKSFQSLQCGVDGEDVKIGVCE